MTFSEKNTLILFYLIFRKISTMINSKSLDNQKQTDQVEEDLLIKSNQNQSIGLHFEIFIHLYSMI